VSTTSIADAQRQVLDAYLGMQQAFARASEIPDPLYPDLSLYASGDALRTLTTGLASMRDEGLRSKGKTVNTPRVEELAPAKNPDTARVRDCMDTIKTVLYKADGTPYNDTPGGRRLVIATAKLTGDTWKITGLGVRDVGSCTG
jgi:hypothetical protein